MKRHSSAFLSKTRKFCMAFRIASMPPMWEGRKRRSNTKIPERREKAVEYLSFSKWQAALNLPPLYASMPSINCTMLVVLEIGSGRMRLPHRYFDLLECCDFSFSIVLFRPLKFLWIYPFTAGRIASCPHTAGILPDPLGRVKRQCKVDRRRVGDKISLADPVLQERMNS